MIAVMRKLLHSTYGMLKTKTAFDPMKFRPMRSEYAIKQGRSSARAARAFDMKRTAKTMTSTAQPMFFMNRQWGNNMTRTILVVLVAACVGGSPSRSSPVEPTGDTASPTVPVHLSIWEEDRQCYGTTVRDLPEASWHGWDTESPYGQCYLTSRRYYPTYATSDGLCLRFANPLQGWLDECDVDDPWIRPCEEVSGCCDHRVAISCHPDYEYQP
jgi:hypothetical protein